MREFYVIRNTTGVESSEKAFALAKLCQENLICDTAEVIIVNSWEQQDLLPDVGVINLDPYTRKPGHVPFDICRSFRGTAQGHANGYRARYATSIAEQIDNIKPGTYWLADDDICTGGTVATVKTLLPQDIRVVREVSILNMYLDSVVPDAYHVADCIDTHDFFGGEQTSGLVVDGKRRLYWQPEVNLETRASLEDSTELRNALRDLALA